jgi:hypothetical protein
MWTRVLGSFQAVFRLKIRILVLEAKSLNIFRKFKDRAVKSALYPVPYTWVAFAWQTPFTLALCYWLYVTPPASYAIDCVGVAGIIMAVRGLRGFTRIEGITWIIIGVLLFGVEIRATAKDRAEQVGQFKAVLEQDRKSVEQSTRRFAEMMDRMKALTELTGQNINEVTGGDSFCVISAYNIVGDNASLLDQHIGRYQLHDVIAHIVYPNKSAEWNTQHSHSNRQDVLDYPGETVLRIGNIPVHGTNTLGTYELDPSGTQDFAISVTALNGAWIEDLSLRRVKGKWTQAYRVYRVIYKPFTKSGKTMYLLIDKLVLAYADAEYPRVKGRIWTWSR